MKIARHMCDKFGRRGIVYLYYYNGGENQLLRCSRRRYYRPQHNYIIRCKYIIYFVPYYIISLHYIRLCLIW